MASKKFKGKFCVYGCGRLATTSDHVFAREFFLPGTSYEPIKVPACVSCNNHKSHLEHYLTALLPFGGRHKDASVNLENMVPKRLARNARLHQLLYKHEGTAWVKESGGLYVPTMTLPVDFNQIELLFKYITIGLTWHHWGARLTSEHFVTVLALSRQGEQVFDRTLFRVNNAAHVANNLGQDTFLYEGVQGVDNPSVTAWKFSIYGGLTFGGDPKAPEEGTSVLGVMTGPSRVLRNAALRARFVPRI
jgi:hypothetical protein